jgi:hypothetical protein
MRRRTAPLASLNKGRSRPDDGGAGRRATAYRDQDEPAAVGNFASFLLIQIKDQKDERHNIERCQHYEGLLVNIGATTSTLICTFCLLLSACASVNYDEQADTQLTHITQDVNQQFITW